MTTRAPVYVTPVDSRLEPAGRCLVCGGAIPAGEGVTARYGERNLRFRCSGCLERFQADPERYLREHPPGCCNGTGANGCSPASEWAFD